MLLADRLILVPAANLVEGLLLPQTGGRGETSPTNIVCKKVIIFEPLLICFAGLLNKFDRWRRDDCNIFIVLDGFDLPFDLLWQEVIISIEKRKPIATTQLNKPIAREVATTIGTEFGSNAIAETANDILTAVRRPVIDYDNLFFQICLVDGTLDALADPLPSVVARN